MSVTPPNGDSDHARTDRIEELLADRAVFGLNVEEAAELADLLRAAGEAEDISYEVAAASVAAATAVAEPLPASLRRRLSDRPSSPAGGETPDTNAPVVVPDRVAAGPAWRAYAVFAVAAGLLVAVYTGVEMAPPAGEDGSIAWRRDALIAEAEDLVRVAWAPQDDAAIAPLSDGETSGESCYGDVVWSDIAQQGYMRFRGLRPNDPEVEQYQLWVFDAERDDRYPVDGGVFDILAEGEQVVPIDARLPIARATLFAITVERPGGVVVSDRSRLPLLAQR